MILWRISNHADLSGRGALQASARWHTAGHPVVYLAENPASALLEILVHLETDLDHLPDRYQLLRIHADDDLPFQTIDPATLPPAWTGSEFATRARGDAWLAARQTALLRLPSAILPETWNWLLNPRHPEAGRVRIEQSQHHAFDTRLFHRPAAK